MEKFFYSSIKGGSIIEPDEESEPAVARRAFAPVKSC